MADFEANSFTIFLFLGLFGLNPISIAQNDESQLIKFEQQADSLADIFLNPDFNDSQKIAAFEMLDEQLGTILQEEISFDYVFDSIKRISVLTSDDKMVRFFTYNFRNSNDRFTQRGYVQYKFNDEIRLKHLMVNEESTSHSQSDSHSVNWRGAIYYQLINSGYKKESHYTLLGWNGNDNLSTKKYIDIFYIDDRGNAQFGKPVIEYPKSLLKSFVEFEYSAEVQMTLHYVEDEKIIVFDHLSPPSSSLTNIYAYYGPDLSYDALVWEKGKWIYKADYDARLDRNLKDRFFEMKLRDQQPLFKNP